jgi:hypothetical protein
MDGHNPPAHLTAMRLFGSAAHPLDNATAEFNRFTVKP